MTAVSTVSSAELAEVNRRLDGAPAETVVEWAWHEFGEGIVLASSMQDCILVDVASRVAPDIEVVFLDTQYHFPETLAYLETVRRRYDLNLRVMTPDVPRDDRWRTDTDACCAVRKVHPLERALEGKRAWMTGLRRVESATRAATPVVGWDVRRGVVKVNPIATWSDDDVERYMAERDLPRHPLTGLGYRSIGCWPCTRPTNDGEDPRTGRWAGSDKTECGLHLD